MDFRLTPEQEGFKRKVEEFFGEEMKNAPPDYDFAGRDAILTEDGWKFHRKMAKKLGEKGWIARVRD